VSPTRIYVTAEVNGKPICCLLDSRCERNVIARSLVPIVKLTCLHFSLSAANKTELPIVGDIDFQFIVDGHSFVANFSISPAIDDFLLESDWLVKNETKWDFAAGVISLGNKSIHAYRCTLNNVCRHILVSEECTMPAKHETNVPVKMQDD